MKKRLISLMLAGAMLTGVGTVAGCGDEEKESHKSDIFEHDNWMTSVYETQIGENLIVALCEKLVTLHKSKVSVVTWGLGTNSTFIVNKVETDCGETAYSSNLTIYDKMPSADKYDKLCEECFPNQN